MRRDLKKINQWYVNAGRFIIRYRWVFITIILALDIISFFGLGKLRINASDQGLFLKDSELKENTVFFEKYFGNNDFLALLVEADDVFDPEILGKIRRLGTVLNSEIPLCDAVISLANFEMPFPTEDGFRIMKLVPETIPKDKKAINALKKRIFSNHILINKLFSDDSKQTWIIVYLKPYPENWESDYPEHPEQLIGQKVTEILGRKEFSGLKINAGGYPVTQFEAKVFFLKETFRAILLSILLTIILLTIFLRSVRGVIFPFFTTLSSILIVYGTMGYLGTEVNNKVITIPIFLGMAISIGYSVHIFNFFRYRFRQTGKRLESILYSLEHTGWPIFFTALTTFGSLLSFTLIPIAILRWMGLTTALIVLTIYVIVITITPALLSFGKKEKEKEVYLVPKRYSSQMIAFRLGKFILRRRVTLTIVMISLICILIIFSFRTRINVDHKNTFGMKLDYIKKAHYIANTKIGSLYCYNITLEFSKPGKIKDPDILKKIDRYTKYAEKLELIKRVTTVNDVVKELNMVMNGGRPGFFRIPEKRDLISQLFLLYEMSGGGEIKRWIDYDYKLLRILVEINDYDSTKILDEQKKLNILAKKLFPDAKVRFTGVIYRVAHIQDYIVKGEIISFLAALIIVMVLMSMVFKSIKAGLIGISPILFSSITVLGVMGIFNIPLNLITMTIIPILLGIGVDDSIHFINHMKFEADRGEGTTELILRGFKAVGYALFITSFILVSIFFIYATSIVKMFVHFGLVSSAGVIAALAGTYIFIPILVRKIKPFRD